MATLRCSRQTWRLLFNTYAFLGDINLIAWIDFENFIHVYFFCQPVGVSAILKIHDLLTDIGRALYVQILVLFNHADVVNE